MGSISSDILKIMLLPYYNRYSDKTQVYSLVENDDIARRSLHVQMVSYISRSICRGLGLDENLAEVISLAHDIGHTPFGHVGERYLSRLLYKRTGLKFTHNVQSVRIVEDIFNLKLSTSVLCGIYCHCGRFFDSTTNYLTPAMSAYKSKPRSYLLKSIQNSRCIENTDKSAMVADTLEGIVVRISDVLAYIIRDRADTLKIGYGVEFKRNIDEYSFIKKLIDDIVQHSDVKKEIISISSKNCSKLLALRKENTEKIYIHSDYNGMGEEAIFPLFEELYALLLKDLNDKNEDSVIYRHHIGYLKRLSSSKAFCIDMDKYLSPSLQKNEAEVNNNLIVCDFISSMSDDYFVSLARHLIPTKSAKLLRQGYFDKGNYLTFY